MLIEAKGLIAACTLSCAGALVYMMAPLLIGGYMDSTGLDAGQAGLLLAAYFAGYTVFSASGILWLHRFNTRVLAGLALLLLVTGLYPLATLSNYQFLLGSMALSGAGAGVCYALAVALIAATNQPDRNFGFALSAQILTGGILLFIAPALFAPRWGFSGTVAAVMAATLLIGLVLPWLPRKPAAAKSARNIDDRTPSSTPALVGTFGLLVWFSGISALWIFIERIGVEIELDAITIGTVLSLSVVPGIIGSMSAASIGDHFGRRIPHILGALIILAATIPLARGTGIAAYATAVCLIIFAWNFWLAYLLGTLTSVDLTGRFSSFYTAALGLGAAIGPAAGGLVATQFGLGAVLLAGLGAVMGGLMIALWLLSFIRSTGLAQQALET